MIRTLQVVVDDGSVPAGTIEPLRPHAQRIDIPRGEDSVIRLVIRKPDYTRVDLTTYPTIRLAVRRQLADASAMFTREAVLRPPTFPDDADEWTASVELDSADTLGLIEKNNYHLDVQLTDDDGNRWQGVPDSVFHILPIVGNPGEPILPPLVDEGAPIAIGPAGLSVLHGDRPPLPSDGRDGEFWIDESSPTRDLYGPKTDGDWGLGFPLRGPEGPPGAGSVSTDDPLPVAAAADPGVGPEPSAWDHVHAHGDLAGGSLHALAVAGASSGFMSGTMAQQLADLVAADFGAQIADVASDLTTLAGTVAGHTSTLASHTSSIATLTSDLASLTSTVSGHTSTLASHTSSIATLTSGLSTANANIATNTADIASLTSTVAGISASYVPNTRTITPGAGLVGAAALDLTADRTLAIGQNADNSITVNANDIQLSTALQTAISTNTSDIASLTSTVAGLSAVYVPQTRTLTPGAGLVGSAALDLSANRTLDVGANGDGSIVVNANDVQVGILATDAQHGNRGGGGLHANVVTGGASGFMTGAQATALAAATTNIATNTSSISALGAVKYLVQVADAAVPNAQAMGVLATGLVKNTTTTGVQSIAAANTDYAHPSATYIVQTSTNAPGSAQVLGALGTGILKSTTTTGVLSIAAAADMPAPGGQLGGTFASATVLGIRETSGPTSLTFGTVVDGEFLKRVGSTVVSAVPVAYTPGATKRVPFGNSGGTALTDDAGFTWDSTNYRIIGQGGTYGSGPSLELGTGVGSVLKYNTATLTVATGGFTLSSASGHIYLNNGTTHGNLGIGVGSSGVFNGATCSVLLKDGTAPSTTPTNASQIYSQSGDLCFQGTSAAGNFRIGSMAAPASMVRGICVTNGTAPSGNPTGGPVMWGEAGALKARGTSGTNFTVVAADPHCPSCGADFVLEFENADKYGYLALCVKCLADELGPRGWILHTKQERTHA